MRSLRNASRGFPVQRMGKIAVFVVFFIILGHKPVRTEVRDMTALKISSPAFRHNEHIPAKYTCDGTDVNPALAIENVPAGAKSLALIVDDPDAPAGTWVHWVVYNIPPDAGGLAEGAPKAKAADFNLPGLHAFFQVRQRQKSAQGGGALSPDLLGKRCSR